MTKELEKRRAEADSDPAGYSATIDSIEPDIHPIDASAFYASAAISLKRIADVADLFALSLLQDSVQKDKDFRDWGQRHGFGDLFDEMNK